MMHSTLLEQIVGVCNNRWQPHQMHMDIRRSKRLFVLSVYGYRTRFGTATRTCNSVGCRDVRASSNIVSRNDEAKKRCE